MRRDARPHHPKASQGFRDLPLAHSLLGVLESQLEAHGRMAPGTRERGSQSMRGWQPTASRKAPQVPRGCPELQN